MSLSSLKGWVLDSPPVRQGYIAFQQARAGLAHLAHLPLAEGDARLRALRALPDERVPAAMGPVLRLIADSCRDSHGTLGSIAENRLLAAFVNSRRARSLRRRWATFPISDRVHLREPNPRPNPERVGNIIILKTPGPQSRERGVILVKYTEAFEVLAATFDLRSLAEEYTLVLEPSSWGYQDMVYLLYLGRDFEVVVQAPRRADFEFIRDLGTNLQAIQVGAGDWVDPTMFSPPGGTPRTYDLAMVASWNPVKRHDLLFRTLADLKRYHRRRLHVALVGYAQQWTKQDVAHIARRYGVFDQCSWFEQLPHHEVARVVAESKAFVLLSQREGASKALYESMFCDTPVIVPKGHRGINLDHIVPEVGIATSDYELGQSILRVIDNPKDFHPRAWAVANTGWPRAAEKLNALLRGMAQRDDRHWASDIVPKRNGPELRYVDRAKLQEFEPVYQALTRHLVPAL